MRRVLKTEIHSMSGVGRTKAHSTSFDSFRMPELGKILIQARNIDMVAGKPKRKLAPVSTYLLEHLIQRYFAKYASRGDTLVQIIIKDTHEI